MDISTWLDGDRGRLKALAEHFGLTQSAVSQWRVNGVPLGRMRAVRDFTRGAVSLEDMVPAPADGQPLTAGPSSAASTAASDPQASQAEVRDAA